MWSIPRQICKVRTYTYIHRHTCDKKKYCMWLHVMRVYMIVYHCVYMYYTHTYIDACQVNKTTTIHAYVRMCMYMYINIYIFKYMRYTSKRRFWYIFVFMLQFNHCLRRANTSVVTLEDGKGVTGTNIRHGLFHWHHVLLIYPKNYGISKLVVWKSQH